MLRTLDIRDMLIIDRLELEFQPGLNVLTGETGAGKSILLDSLGFVLGWRGRAELVRSGAEKGEVTAQFDLPSGHRAWSVLEDAGFEHDGELILRRTNYPDGRKQAYINDRRASGELLRMLSETLVELHGQHDDRGILNPKAHREMLDSFAGLDLTKIGTLWQSLTAAKRELKRAEKALDEIRAEEEFLRHAVSELDALDPQPGQEAELDVKRRQMQAGERIRDDISKALQALGLNGAEGMSNDAARWLDGVSDQAEGQLDAPLAALERVANDLNEAQQGVEAVLERLQFDPQELEQVEEQLFALRGLARKHDVLADDLATFAEGLRIRLAALDGGEVELADLRKALAEATERYQTEADRITAARQAAATKLDKAMGAELAPLKMERAVFKTDVTREAPSAEGQDDVSFTVATNPGAPSGPLNKIASGGELSRFLLALKVCLSGTTEGVTMIFDEIDRGVGGATADAVGRRLKSLADGAQVLVVTHSPQVAALGGHHWRVEKQVRDEQTFSTVIPLDEAARITEIARMVSGDTITDAAKDAARSLLKV
ncbi:DNA repair protein RecN [Litoreibacter albidus]|uniref:DNA repair protein RecN n=1 Tax=Litoreibacter albidus TaxID=670155 RepID=A0A1H3BAC0_9RHOB|nr:DNA repair protein RecN [Litoreibacter albidus]SDX37969.1 DNA replication and repair protein RecN [Litoreibacter albidus]